MTKLLPLNKTRDKILFGMAVSIFCMCAFDAWATYQGVAKGLFSEANPIMAYAISFGPAVFYYVKLLITGMALAFLYITREHRLAIAGLILTLIGYLIVMGIHIFIYLNV